MPLGSRWPSLRRTPNPSGSRGSAALDGLGRVPSAGLCKGCTVCRTAAPGADPMQPPSHATGRSEPSDVGSALPRPVLWEHDRDSPALGAVARRAGAGRCVAIGAAPAFARARRLLPEPARTAGSPAARRPRGQGWRLKPWGDSPRSARAEQEKGPLHRAACERKKGGRSPAL